MWHVKTFMNNTIFSSDGYLIFVIYIKKATYDIAWWTLICFCYATILFLDFLRVLAVNKQNHFFGGIFYQT